jgi:N-acetylneuraminic acid mutarotase
MPKGSGECPVCGKRATGRRPLGRMPPTLVWGLLRLALLMLVPHLALAVPGAAQETWTATSTTNAPSGRRVHTAVWTGAGMIAWGGWAEDGTTFNTGGTYDPDTDRWSAIGVAPSARYLHTAVWTGSNMIVWGGFESPVGYVNTGHIYDPATDTWSATTSTMNAPSGRDLHTAIWTGRKMIVWGGEATGTPGLDTGGIYDPATDTWSATSTTNSPSARKLHAAVWTGSKMIVWGGTDTIPTGNSVNTGGSYDPTSDTWTGTTTMNAPSARYLHTAVWTGSKMIVWGGYDANVGVVSTGGIYDPATDTWTATSTTGAPAARSWHTAVWTGSKMVVWGGVDGAAGFLNTGGVYDPAADSWTPMSVSNAPTARYGSTAVWTGSKMIVWGGSNGLTVDTGGVYSNPAVLSPPPPPAGFFTVTPCRLADTRNAAGPTGGPALAADATRSFPVTGGVCGIPSTATAVSVNLTVTQPAARGHLTLYPGDAGGPPLTSSINFAPGLTRASNAVVRLGMNGVNSGTIYVKNGSAGSVHLVLDVNGYFQ